MPASERAKEQLLTAKLLLGGEKRHIVTQQICFPILLVRKISVHSPMLKKGQKRYVVSLVKKHKPL